SELDGIGRASSWWRGHPGESQAERASRRCPWCCERAAGGGGTHAAGAREGERSHRDDRRALAGHSEAIIRDPLGRERARQAHPRQRDPTCGTARAGRGTAPLDTGLPVTSTGKVVIDYFCIRPDAGVYSATA